MTEERFSHIVCEYFTQRGTHPATLLFKNAQVDDKFLLNLDKELQDTFENRNDILLHNTKIIEGDYWSGVLLEFNQNEFDGVDSTDFTAMKNNDTLNATLSQIYDDFSEYDTRITGFSTGDSVYAVAALEYLGKAYFKQQASNNTQL